MENDIKIRCATHGESSEAFVCQHLFAGESLGFHWCCNPQQADGWEMTHVAAYLLNAADVYRTPRDDSFTFMVILKASRAL